MKLLIHAAHIALLLTSFLGSQPIFLHAWAATSKTAQAANDLPADIETAIESRRKQALEWTREAGFQPSPKLGPYDVLAAAVRDGCGSPRQAQFMVDLGHAGLGQERDELFALPALVRYLYTFPECLSGDQKQALLEGLTSTRRLLFGHGTLNHMVLQETSWYLLAQYFPEAQWTDQRGIHLTSAEVMAQLKDLLTRRHWRTFQSGTAEMVSPTYAMADFYPLLNLVDFAKDKEVAKQASDEAALEILVLKADAFHGILMPPLTRHNSDQTNTASPKTPGSLPLVAQTMLWYYFGEPQIGVYDLANPVHEPLGIIIPLLSSWRPPAAAWSMPSTNYTLRIRTPNFTKWDDPTFPMAYGDSRFGRDYAIGTGNFVFDPRNYNDHNQSFALAFKSDAQRNLLECQHPYWRSNEGEDGWTTDLWSPFLQNWRLDDNHAVLLASIPKKDPWTKAWSKDVEDRFWHERDKHADALLPLVQCRIPKAVDQIVVDDQWAFFRKGKVFVALGSLDGVFEQAGPPLPPAIEKDFTVVKLRQPKSALFIAVDENGGSFTDFQAKAKASAPKYDPDGPSITFGKTSVRFKAPAPDPAHPNFWQALPEVSIQGNIQRYATSPVIESPFLTLADGVLKVKTTPSLEIDGPKRPAGNRPAAFQ